MSTTNDAGQLVFPARGPADLATPEVPAEAAFQSPGLGPADVWRVVKQRKLLISVTFFVLCLGVGAGTFLVWRFAPLYSSEAYIQFLPPARGPWGSEESILPKDYIQHQLATEAARIEDLVLLQEVLAQPEIKVTQFYREYPSFDECLYDLKARLSVSPVRETYLIRVAIATRQKSEATLIANTVVDRHLQRSRSSLTDDARRRIEGLKQTRLSVEQELAAVRERIANRRAQQDVPAMEADRNVQAEMVSTLNNTIAELKTRESDILAQLQTVQGVDPRNLPLSAEMRVIVESDPVLRYYRQQVEALDIQIDTLRRHLFGDQHRQMQILKSQRDNYFEKETARREELIQDLRSRQVESLQQELARVRGMMAEVREQLAERENAQRDLDAALQQLRLWEKDEDRLTKALEEVGRELMQEGHQIDVQRQEGRLALAMPARDAVKPSRPNFLTYLGGGFVLAAVVAVGLAFLREFTDQALRTPIDVARHGHLSVLACIPLLDDDQVDIDEMENATRQAPQSIIAEAFRQVRAHLTFSGPLESQRTLLVTSPRPDDGKTSVAINLAVTFAQANERTLLVDCNFRRPAIRRAFAHLHSEGLSNVLVGHEQFETAVCRTELPNLDVLTSGPMPPNPAELLGSRQMRALLEAAAAKYDRVVLDGPPCLLISDALVVATQVDAVVLVARAVNGTKGTLRRAREQLQRIHARVIGAVLNGVQARPGGYFRQQYREFYEYMDEEVVMHSLPAGPAGLDQETAPHDDESDKS